MEVITGFTGVAIYQLPMVNWEPIGKWVGIDVWAAKMLPIDQSDQLTNRAQQITLYIDTQNILPSLLRRLTAQG